MPHRMPLLTRALGLGLALVVLGGVPATTGLADDPAGSPPPGQATTPAPDPTQTAPPMNSSPATTTPAPATTSPTTTPAPAPSPSPGPLGDEPVVGQQGSEPTSGNGVRAPGPAGLAPPAPANGAPTDAVTRRATKFRGVGGAPTAANPTFSFALPGPAPIGVPNFFIEKFRIPPLLLPLDPA